MLKIRLSRIGKKGQAAYKIVIAEKTKAVKKQYIEAIGSYNPSLKPALLQIKKDRFEHWVSKGAQATKTVAKLLQKA